MSSKPLPNEIFAKIFGHFREKASHTDMKNLHKALDHPDFDHYHEVFEHLSSRSQQESTEEGNFICPICLFSQKGIYDDSVWDELCQKVFGCHFILFGANQLAKTRRVRTYKRKRPSTNQNPSPAQISNKYLLQFLFSNELMLKQCRQRSIKKCPNYPFTASYIRKIHYSKACKNTMDGVSKQLSNLKFYSDVGEFINHLDECSSHYYKPSIKTSCDDDHSDVNYDYFYKMKIQGKPIEELSRPRELMRKLTRDNSTCLSDLISLKQPDPNLFDTGSQNHDFLEFILWPILTFAISIQLEDHLTFPTSQFRNVSRKNRQVLALRDLLRCICEVSENLEYDFEIDTWVKAKFAVLHGMLEILDSFFPEY